MGNDQSKREDKEDAPRGVSQYEVGNERAGLPALTPLPVKDIVSRALPVDPRWYETPDTPTSDVSFTDSDFEREDDNARGKFVQSHPPAQLLPSDDDLPDEPDTSQTVEQLLERFARGPESLQLLVGFLEYPCIQKVTFLAKCLGFESCRFDVPFVHLNRSMTEMTAESRGRHARQSWASHIDEIDEMDIGQLDEAMEKSLATHLKHVLQSKRNTEHWNQAVLVEYDVHAFLLPIETVKRIFQDVATECHVRMQLSHQHRIALTVASADASETENEVRTEKTIQKGELVWRRLQHWSTNVRKEKKFNIWAKGLAEEVKERILKIALEIGFETAEVQQNGNIHLEIKPPEGQHRRKLKHATDELRMELEPIDEAVCQNVEQHLNEWLSEFHRNGKQKDVLNCRFVLPAEWLRNTSERLAAQYGLSVSMETGIELLFYRSDMDPALLQESAGSKDASSTNTNKKSKSKNRAKKKTLDSSSSMPMLKSEASTSNGVLGEAITVPPPPSHLSFDQRMSEHVLSSRTSSSLPLAPGAVRRTSSRNKYDYGWDPSWPTAHPADRAATSHQQQHTF